MAYIDTGPGTQNFLQFADDSYQETISQVTAYWTFASSEKALLTFEVLEDCASEVVIGEDFLFKHNIFADHTSSLRMLEFDCDSYELAPFDFISSWQQKCLNVKSRLHRNKARGKIPLSTSSHLIMKTDQAHKMLHHLRILQRQWVRKTGDLDETSGTISSNSAARHLRRKFKLRPKEEAITR
jgi:hypothetical protein